ncbi:MAG: 16S rRNA (cytidine(1402)-2'-O)-methyltransferase [Deltaproteobacteria bacterium]|nr:16S rRNA (cytidine(1402)-2'-O)-methyltransferase [Deltaproteobacteria bacterium]
MPGRLYVVATPIGNLDDLSPRARSTLSEVALIACEDTRVTSKLLARHQLTVPLFPLHAHSSDEDRGRILDRLIRGEDVALVSDAGAPLISDPGRDLVADALARNVAVIPIPGPSAVTTALMASGVDAGRFVFLGFLPRDPTQKRELLLPFTELPLALVLFESKERLVETLVDARATLGDRSACVARELTKKFETFERGRLSELEKKFEGEVKGELTLVIGPPEERAEPALSLEVLRVKLAELLEQGISASEAAKLVAGAYHVPKREVYRLALELNTKR